MRTSRLLATLLHMLISVGALFLLISSWWMMALPLPSKVFTYRVLPFQLHKNVGMTLFVFTVALLYVRVRHLSGIGLGRGQARRGVQHLLLYGLVFACCLSGYLSSVYSGWATRVWWLFDLPNWGGDNDELNIVFSDIHNWTFYGLIGVMAVHVGVAMWSAFKNEGIIRRMLHF